MRIFPNYGERVGESENKHKIHNELIFQAQLRLKPVIYGAEGEPRRNLSPSLKSYLSKQHLDESERSHITRSQVI